MILCDYVPQSLLYVALICERSLWVDRSWCYWAAAAAAAVLLTGTVKGLTSQQLQDLDCHVILGELQQPITHCRPQKVQRAPAMPRVMMPHNLHLLPSNVHESSWH